MSSPTECPTCGSRQPSMHPAVGGGGEVTSLCPDPFHNGDPVTENARQYFQMVHRETDGSDPLVEEPGP
jgi:hypothetical protein